MTNYKKLKERLINFIGTGGNPRSGMTHIPTYLLVYSVNAIDELVEKTRWIQVSEGSPKENKTVISATLIEELLKANRWIPVSERLPNIKKGEMRVFATIQDKYYKERMTIALRYNAYRCDWLVEGSDGVWLSEWMNGSFEVVAWKPLPEPYKGEQG